MKMALLLIGTALAFAGCDKGGTGDQYGTSTGAGSTTVTSNYNRGSSDRGTIDSSVTNSATPSAVIGDTNTTTTTSTTTTNTPPPPNP
jgi:hypothetical protein